MHRLRALCCRTSCGLLVLFLQRVHDDERPSFARPSFAWLGLFLCNGAAERGVVPDQLRYGLQEKGFQNGRILSSFRKLRTHAVLRLHVEWSDRSLADPAVDEVQHSSRLLLRLSRFLRGSSTHGRNANSCSARGSWKSSCWGRRWRSRSRAPGSGETRRRFRCCQVVGRGLCSGSCCGPCRGKSGSSKQHRARALTCCGTSHLHCCWSE